MDIRSKRVLKKDKKYLEREYDLSGRMPDRRQNSDRHMSGFPMVGPPFGVVRDLLGGSASYNLFGGIEEIDVPNFGTVSAWEDE